jgi:GrpB-like predicted nucleotidyltransferase (UPF0157 family)
VESGHSARCAPGHRKAVGGNAHFSVRRNLPPFFASVSYFTHARRARLYGLNRLKSRSGEDAGTTESMERYGGGSIVVSDYNPAWPATFEQERTSLHTALGPLVLTIEHIGSTAVPGLAAKPIIDLQLSVRSLAEARSSCVGPLQALGYAYMPQYEARLPGELFFRKGLSGPWTHHLHILQGDHPRWQRRLLFRDYLRNHPEVARAYAKLKRDLAAAFDDDISGYMNAKTTFVAATLAEALGPGEQVVLDRHLPTETSRS